MKTEKQEFKTAKGTVEWFTLTNDNGAQVVLSSLGAGIVAVRVPDAEGNMADVVIGYPNAEDYFADGPCAGKVPGRFANRIANGKFTLDGKEYTLPINNGPNSLHGGPEGYMNQIWDAETDGEGTVTFRLRSADGDSGYPGNLVATARYHWDNNNALTLDLEAETDAPTVVNLTNHAYFNLDGHNSGSCLDHKLQIKASKWLPVNEVQIPLGEIAPVAGTPMDFTVPRAIGEHIHDEFEALKIGKGYDNCWMFDDYDGTLREVVELVGPRSGRKLLIATTQPGVQVYTGNWLDGCPTGKDGYTYHDYDAVAIECQGCPDAPNHPNFPSQVLRPGEKYHETIRFTFA